MSYEVIFHPGAIREFDKLPKAAQERLASTIDALEIEPRPRGAIKLSGAEAYRIRVGNYRAAYAVKDEKLIVLVVSVGHRKDVYHEMETIRKRLRGS